ncbi:hypothetical protein FA13DRAFT_807221 [Coprinellus micaceus]|uniref:Uncharacterized protein n=1 Tax=Coprinellus micaceus TaxID=71717 RepID=A0A4Y7S4Y4_COPMI|nr:hypothetical protein FA13DRAFT_807221 [Coprinellus micaceus]
MVDGRRGGERKPVSTRPISKHRRLKLTSYVRTPAHQQHTHTHTPTDPSLHQSPHAAQRAPPPVFDTTLTAVGAEVTRPRSSRTPSTSTTSCHLRSPSHLPSHHLTQPERHPNPVPDTAPHSNAR